MIRCSTSRSNWDSQASSGPAEGAVLAPLSRQCRMSAPRRSPSGNWPASTECTTHICWRARDAPTLIRRAAAFPVMAATRPAGMAGSTATTVEMMITSRSSPWKLAGSPLRSRLAVMTSGPSRSYSFSQISLDWLEPSREMTPMSMPS